jgi:hypothetical protein
MYEIWLMLNIVWEIALGLWPLLLGGVLLWLVLLASTWRRAQGRWRQGLWPAMLIAGVVGIAALLLIPGWTRSSLSELGYWVDWANLMALAAAAGALVLAFAWPLLAGRRKRPSRT